jgi:hypothetical protein
MDAPLLEISDQDLANILGLSHDTTARGTVHPASGKDAASFAPVGDSDDNLLAGLFTGEVSTETPSPDVFPPLMEDQQNPKKTEPPENSSGGGDPWGIGSLDDILKDASPPPEDAQSSLNSITKKPTEDQAPKSAQSMIDDLLSDFDAPSSVPPPLTRPSRSENCSDEGEINQPNSEHGSAARGRESPPAEKRSAVAEFSENIPLSLDTAGFNSGSTVAEPPPPVIEDKQQPSVSTPQANNCSPHQVPAVEKTTMPPTPRKPPLDDDEVCNFSSIKGSPGLYRMSINRTVNRRSLEIMLHALEAADVDLGDELEKTDQSVIMRATIYKRAADRIEAGLSLQAALADVADGADGMASLPDRDAEMTKRWAESIARGSSLAKAILNDAGGSEVDFLHVRGRPDRPDWASALKELSERIIRGKL